jgi:ferredoxin--NADP+ reductase
MSVGSVWLWTDAIHPRKDEPAFASEKMLYIDPDSCIDCGACEPAWPVQAIFPDTQMPPQWAHYAQINVDWYQRRR